MNNDLCQVWFGILVLVILDVYGVIHGIRLIRGKPISKNAAIEYTQTLWIYQFASFLRGIPIPKKLSLKQMQNAGYWSLGAVVFISAGIIYVLVKYT